jgi:outer membrane protein, heavy metal efflux system
MHHFLSQRLSSFTCSVIISLLCVSMQGCIKHSYKEQPINTSSVLSEINSWNIDNPDLNQFLKANGISAEQLNGNSFSVERLYLTSLFYDPEMQVAYKKWKKAQVAAEHADYKINPELSIPFEHHSDTSAGQSEWTIGAVLSFIYERKGKREARQARANIDLLNAQLAITKRALKQHGHIEEQYHAYIVTKTKILEIENEIDVLKELLEQLEKKYELGAVSQFEISTIKLELQQRLFQLTLQENILQQNKDDLLALSNLSHSEYDAIEVEYTQPLTLAKELYQNPDIIDADISSLQSSLLDNHLDMAMMLNEYAQSEAELRLEIEKQYPDIVLSPGFIFDQSDNIWALGASWVLPLFKNTEQNLKILGALEDRKIKQREVVVMQKELLNSLYVKYKSILRHKETLGVSDEIIESIEQRANEINTQLEIGGVDSIVLLRNRMEFYKAKQAQIEIYSEAIDAMHEIEHLLQTAHSGSELNQVVASWLTYKKEKETDEFIN